MLQWGAPGHVLGQPGERRELQAELLVAVTPGLLDEAIRQLTAELAAPDGPLPLPSPDVLPIRFYVDLAGTPEWVPLGRERDGRHILLPFAEVPLSTR